MTALVTLTAVDADIDTAASWHGVDFGRAPQTWDHPTAPTINSPVDGAAYSTSLTLSASASNLGGDTTWHAEFEYRKGAGAWTAIGNGTTVSVANPSTRTWALTGLTLGIDYQVRARVVTTYDASPWTQTGNFLIGPSLSSLHAVSNTTSYSARNNTATYRAEKA